VDVVVVRAGMVGIAAQDRFELRLDLTRAVRRLTVGAPQLPRVHVHCRLGAQCLDVQVVREALCQLAHRGRIGARDRLEACAIERL